ncbi:MAG: hypothetical protein ABFS12_08765 [Bacteroidota bacterium]
MTNLDTFDLSLNISYPYLFLFIILAILYTIFIYRYTIPTTTKLVKSLLVSLRVLAISLIILLIFEPSLSIKYDEKIDPINLIFVDNSQSIVNRDSVKRKTDVAEFLSKFSKNVDGENRYYSFSSTLDTIAISEDDTIAFDGSSTNFEQIVSFIKNTDQNIASATIVSDGIINDGSNSSKLFERVEIPVFTIALGDTTKRTDLEIKKVLYNDLIYANSPNEIKVVLLNRFLSDEYATLSLYEDSKLIDQKSLQLDESGINNISFPYTPKYSGEKHLLVTVSQLANEETYENNKYPFIANVLKDKIKVLCISGAPSPDYSVIKQILKNNNKIDFDEIVQLTETKFLNDGNFKNKVDSADIILMIDFPTLHSPSKLLSDINSAINKKHKPYFLVLSESVDQKKLKLLADKLPFKLNSYSSSIREIYPLSYSAVNPLISGDKKIWNSLPPIFQLESRVSAAPGSNILIYSKMKNIETKTPLIFTYNLTRTRAIVFNGFGFWKWKLQRNEVYGVLLESFFNNSIKWLYSDIQEERIFVSPVKKVFNHNDDIEFRASIYDETLNPRNDAVITITAKNNLGSNELQLKSIGNGIYEGKFNINKPGEYSYTSKIELDNLMLSGKPGKFIVADVNIENINYVLNKNYLKLISNITRGNSFVINNYENLFDDLNFNQKSRVIINSTTIEYDIWSNQWVLVLILVLFSIEWFLRKRKGLI